MPDRVDFGDEEQMEEARLQALFVRKREVDALTDVLSTYNGRLTIWRIMVHCGRLNVAPVDRDELQRFEGGRDVAMWMINEVFTSDIQADIRMTSEALERHIAGEKDNG